MVNYILISIGIFALYVLLYYWFVQGRFSNRYYTFRRFTDIVKQVDINNPQFSRLAIFNPSVQNSFNEGGYARFICRHTPGHQPGAGLNFLEQYEYREIEGYNNTMRGVIFQPRAISGYINKSLEITDYELVYFPINVYEWQWESSIWLQGEDIRFINSPSGNKVIAAMPGKNNSSTRLGIFTLKRDPITSKLMLIPDRVISPEGQRNKNWIGVSEEIFIKSISPTWVVGDGEYVVDIHKKLDLRISDWGTAPYNHNLHLGGCICRFTDHSYLIAVHTFRPYRNLFVEISDTYPYLPIRFGGLVQFTGGMETYIENITTLSRMDDEHILVGMGLEDSSTRFLIIKICTINDYLYPRSPGNVGMEPPVGIPNENQYSS